MTITIFKHNVKDDMSAYYYRELNSIMCMIEAYCYVNRIPYSFKNPTIYPDSIMSSFIKIRHKLFESIDSQQSKYVTDAIINNMTADMLMTVNDD